MNRRSIRFQKYNYTKPGFYFITICTQNRERLFGQKIVADMIDKWWNKISQKFSNSRIDQYMIMPDHFHGIIEIVGVDPCVDPSIWRIDQQDEYAVHEGGHMGDKEGGHMGPPLHRMIQWFKTMTTNQYIQNVKNQNWITFEGRLWQRNYYERVIRNETELDQLREYIRLNPVLENDHSMYSKPIHNQP